MNYCYKAYRQIFLLLILSLWGITPSNAQNIYTVAGVGVAGYTGDGGAATAAQIWWPYSVSADPIGGFYLGGDWWWSGSGAARIRQVNALGIINSVVGTGTAGFSGDGGPASSAQIWGGGTATDASGNLYIADWGNYRIRKVNTSGIISTVAGNGSSGAPSGDGGPATSAALGWGSGWWGWGLSSDPYGNLYIYCWGYNIVRRVDASTGIITKFAGNGTYGFSGDGSAATSAMIGQLYGIAADGAGNVYMSDWAFRRVRKVNSSGIISTYAGTGSTGWGGDGGPATATGVLLTNLGCAVDGGGNLYIADYSNNRIRKVDAAGTIYTVAGTGTYSFSGDGGPATACTFRNPYNVATDGAGNVYVADYANIRIRKIINYNRPPSFTAGTSATLTVCQNSLGDSVNTQLAVHDSDMYQYLSWTLLTPPVHGTALITYGTVTTSTTLITTPRTCSYKPASGYTGLDSFKARVFDGFVFDTITIYVTVNPLPGSISGVTAFSASGYTVLSATPPGGVWSSSAGTIAATGGTTGIISGVSGGTATITYTLPTGCIRTTTVNVFPYAGQQIVTVAGNGTAGYLGDGVAATSTRINQSYGVVTDASGNFYIADSWNNRIRKVNSSGVISTIAGTGTGGFSGDGGAATAAQLFTPTGVALDASGNIYVADQDNHRVRKISTTGVITTVAGIGTSGFSGDGAAATLAQLYLPTGLTTDGSGNIYIADQYNNRIRKVNSSGIISTIAGTGTATYGGDTGPATAAQINHPCGVAMDAAGNIYITDFTNNRIRKINTSGIITTFAGTGVSGSTGDGGAAASARLANPWGISVDAIGNVFVTDNANNRVRKINLSNIINTIAGTGTAGYGGDACAASAATINLPAGISVDAIGSIYFADRNNNRIRKISDNHAPAFPAHRQPSSMCQSSVDTINSLLAVLDLDLNQSLTWSVLTGATHGSVTASYTATSTGALITPTGLYYTPTVGYAGTDSFKVQVTDCSGGVDTTWIVVTINPPPSSITGASSVCAGLSTTFTLTGTGLWSSSSTAIADVGSLSGVVTGVSAGVATITFAPGASCFVTKNITVNAAPAAVVGPTSICAGTPITYTDATPSGTWSATGVATVSSTGVLTGTAAGIASITYTRSGCPAWLDVTVNTAPAFITGLPWMCADALAGYTSSTPGGVWSSSTPAVGSIDPGTGVVSGIAVGFTTISYTIPSGCYVTYGVSVYPVPTPILGSSTICIGQSRTMTDLTPSGVWSFSSIGSVLSIDSTSGLMTGLAIGTATISYSTIGVGPGCSITKEVTVDPAPSAISGPSTLCIGQNITLTNSITGGTWTSGTTSRATVGSTSGIVMGVGSGTVNITYTTPAGCFVTKTLTVSAGVASITGTPTVCVGLTTPLSCSTPGGTWTSVTPSVASVGGAGVVLGVSGGTTIISYTIPAGCASTYIVTVNSSPGIITGTLNACPAGTRVVTCGSGIGTWSSSSPGTASVTSGGLVSAIAPGTTTLSFSAGSGCASTAVFTVNPIPGLISGPTAVCQGSSINLTPTTPGGTWSASGGATIGSSSGVVTGTTSGAASITYTLPTGCYRTTPIVVNITPSPISGASTVCVGASTPLSDTSPGGVWSSSSSGIASVGSSGVVNGVSAGTANIIYTLGTGCNQSKTVTVTPLPSAIVGSSLVCEGDNITLTNSSGTGTWSTTSSYASVGSSSGTVTGTAGGAASISFTLASTGCSVTKMVTINPLPAIVGPSALCVSATITLSSAPGGTWTSSMPGNATIGSATGIVTGIATGPTTISYTAPTGCKSATTVNVSSSPAAITGAGTVCAGLSTTLTDAVPGGWWISSTTAATVGSLSGTVTGVTPGPVTITYSLGSGCTVTKLMTVTASPAAILGSPVVCAGSSTTFTDATSGGTWSTSASGIATVTSAGLVSGIATGTATISYTSGSCAAILPVTVNTAPAAIGGPSQVCAGATITATNSVTGGTWSTSGTALTIGSSDGVINGVGAGTATIMYAIGTCTTNKTITVNAIPSISGPSGVCVGSNASLSASGSGTWSSSATGIATVTSGGLVNGVAPGTADITFSPASGCSATKTVTVNSAPGSISGTLRVCTAQTTTLGNAAGGGIWTSASTSIATVGSLTGEVTGVAAGTANITYSLGSGCIATAVVTVSASPAAIGGPTQMCVGNTITLTDATPSGTWSSIGEPITTGGAITGSTAGVTTVRYTLSSGCYASREVTVNAAAPAITGTPKICVGLTTGLANSASGGTWTSSLTGIATVGATGTVTGVSPGITTITYTLGSGCFATQPVTINAAPGPITGTMQLCIGSTTVLSNGVPGGTWNTGGAGNATVTGGGLVSGITIGTEDISYSVGGCPAVATVTVNPLPSAITGPGQVCVGNNISLSDATTGGSWSSSNPVIAGIDPGTGTVSGYVAGTAVMSYSMGAGCTVNKTITVNPLPAGITGASNICLGNSTTLADVTPGGVWSSAATGIATIGSTGIVSGLAAGTAMISYTIPTGCAATMGVIVVRVQPIEGITNDLCAWGDTLLIHNPDTMGAFSSALVTVTNIGGGNAIVTGFASGVGTITYTLLGLGCRTISTISVNPLPASFSGNDRICLGQTTTLASTTAGGVWTSSNPSAAPISVGGLVSGLAPGTTTITYTLPTGCSIDTTVIVYPMPSPIIGDAQVCEAATTTWSDTTAGGWWTSSHPAVASVGAGTGIITGAGAGVTTITYSLGTTCRVTRNITVNALPAPYFMTGGGNYCLGGTGMHIGLAGSQAGVDYQLYFGSSAAGTPVAGTGTGIDFGLHTGTGTYTVIATNPTTTCIRTLTTSVVVGTTPTVNPAVSVSSSAGNPVCIGTPSTFTALPVNGGSAPAYQWYVNGAIVPGATGTTYSYTPSNGDVVRAELTSSATCAVPPVVTGDLTMNVLNMFVPSVTIGGNPGLTITKGQSDTLVANVVNGSSSQSYLWYWNGWPVTGVYGNTYINRNFANGDSVRVVVTSTGMCGGFTGQGTAIITVVSGVGVQSVSGGSMVQILPNPNKGTFTIKGSFDVADEEVYIEVTNMLGQSVYTRSAATRNGRLDEQVSLGNIASGMYLLNIRSGSDTKVFHIVVEQ